MMECVKRGMNGMVEPRRYAIGEGVVAVASRILFFLLHIVVYVRTLNIPPLTVLPILPFLVPLT